MADLSEVTPNLSHSIDSGSNYGSTSHLVPTVSAGGVGGDLGEHGTWTDQPVTLSWYGLNAYIVPENKKCWKKNEDANPRQILENVNGIVKPGTLLAILGGSGAGKSTLLNVLNQRNTQGLIVDGDVFVNGIKMARQTFSSISAYVQQDDIFIGLLRVKEHLWFQSMLRMDRHIDDAAREFRVNQIIKELCLTKCADTIIGQPGIKNNISGGERKRLAFASEVLTNPPLMFCDEPTSGLDSFMAENVVQTLQGLAAQGKTIICTIHQPSSEVFALFDDLLVLACGRIAYMGPAEQATTYFNSAGYNCPDKYNPADFFIHTLAIKPDRETECYARVKSICDKYQVSEEYKSMINKIESLSDNPQSTQVLVENKESRYKASWCRQFRVLMWRSSVTYLREPFATKLKIVQAIFIGLFFGLIFLQQDYNQKGVMNINGVLFLLETQVTFSSIFSVVVTIPIEFPIFIREHQNGMYRVDTYFLSKMITEVPMFLVVPSIFIGITYWMIGLYPDWEAFLICIGILILVSTVATSYAYLVGCSTSDVTVATAVVPSIIIPLMLFGGFFLNAGSVPVYFIWLQYLSWFNYCNEILIVNQWKHVTNITCEYVNPGFNQTLLAAAPSSRCFTNGQQVIESFSFHEDHVMTDVYALIGLMVGFRILSFVLILYRSSRRS